MASSVFGGTSVSGRGFCGGVLLAAGFVFFLALAPRAVGADEGASDTAAAKAADEQPDEGATLQQGQTAAALGRIMGRLFGGPAEEDEEEALSPLIGEPAPEIKLQTPGGETWSLADERGRVVVLDFWATWCGPCVAAMPKMQGLSDEFSDRGVSVIGVNQGDAAEDVTGFIEKRGFTYKQVLDPDGKSGDRFRVSGIPQIVVVDAEGVVQAVHVGFSPTLKQTLSDEVTRLLNGENIFNELKVAEARKRRAEELELLLKQVVEFRPDRLRVQARTAVEGGVYLDSLTPNRWCRDPAAGAPAIVLDAGNDRVVVLSPGAPSASVVELPLGDYTYMQDVLAGRGRGGLQLVSLTNTYSSSTYDVESSTLAVYGLDGERLWGQELPVLGEYQDDALLVADLDGRGGSEIVVLSEYNEVDFGPDAADVSRVLSVWDSAGKLLCRKWVPGQGGSGIHAAAGEEGTGLLLSDGEGLLVLRFTDDSE